MMHAYPCAHDINPLLKTLFHLAASGKKKIHNTPCSRVKMINHYCLKYNAYYCFVAWIQSAYSKGVP